MTTIARTMTTPLSAAGARNFPFAQVAKTVFASVRYRWTLLRNRRHFMRLKDFDDHLLRDIGLRREDIATAAGHGKDEDPMRILCGLADARHRLEAARRIC